MSKLDCTLLNLTNICLHKTTDSKFYPFTESDKDLLEKIREDMVGGPSIVFRRKAVVDETFIRKSTNLCKSIVGIDASQLYPYSMCQPTPTGLYTRWGYDSETKRFTARQNKPRSLENKVLSYFQQSRPDCKTESNVTTGGQKKNDCFSVNGICYPCNTVFDTTGCYYRYCPCQEARPSLTDNEIMRGRKKREKDQMRKEYIQQKKHSKLLKCGSASRGSFTDLMHQSKIIFERFSLLDVLSAKNNSCKDLSKGDSLVTFKMILKCRNTFSHFPPIFKNTVLSRNDIGDLMKQYAEKEMIMSQPRRMLISSFHLNNGTIMTPLLLFYFDLGLECTKFHQFIQYTPKKCFKSFVQSAVNARRQGDENPNSSVVAETMKF